MSMAEDSPAHSSSSDDFVAFLDAELESASDGEKEEVEDEKGQDENDSNGGDDNDDIDSSRYHKFL